ncbi:MAG: phage tail protein I [Myxococcales bacterium]|nr:phage tail protein I [Myxococcales bacterium]MCB9551339.1 phage tail protein I [Myxococcales bacterium]
MPDQQSTWLSYLPAELRSDAILQGFLLAFERMLSGRTGTWREGYPDDPLPELEGLEEALDRVGALFAPRPDTPTAERTPDNWLPWLANLVAVPLREEYDDITRRRFIRAALPAYARRGTRQGLRDTLARFLGSSDDVRVYEFEDEPHFFQVEVVVRQRSATALARIDRVVRALVDQVRPAHTWYSVRYLVPSMQIIDDPGPDEEGILVGVNTLLGTRSSG